MINNNNAETIISTLFHANQLKRTARTGWVMRGVPDPENVAAHSYGVAFTALTLAQLSDEPVDLGKLLSMAILHDLPEGLTTDIPTPAWRYLPPGVKLDVERGAMNEILESASFRENLLMVWEELHEGQSVEAKLTHDADKIDLYLQTYIYEQQTGSRQLAGFWSGEPSFHSPAAQAVYNWLYERRVDNS
jgi:putative hydrolases of HD superfamily